MTTIGETLRGERLRRNLDLEHVSQELKISSRLLEAIETEKFDRLPGGVFTKSFVRQYARLLGLDEEEIVGQLQRLLEPPEATEQPNGKPQPAAAAVHVPRVNQWEAVGDKKPGRPSLLPALAMVVVVMLICSGVYAFWQRKGRPAAPASHPPVAQAAPVKSAEPAPPTPPPQPPAAPPVTTPQAETAPPAAEAAPAGAPAAPVTQAAPAAVTPAAAPNGEAQVRVELVATEPVWVLARGDGKYLFSGTLETNQTRTVEAGSSVEIRVGNAGGVSITFNGKPVGPIGPRGQVRTVQFTSGGFQIVAAPKPVPLDPF